MSCSHNQINFQQLLGSNNTLLESNQWRIQWIGHRVGWGRKHEIYAVALGGQLFFTLTLDPLLQILFSNFLEYKLI